MLSCRYNGVRSSVLLYQLDKVLLSPLEFQGRFDFLNLDSFSQGIRETAALIPRELIEKQSALGRLILTICGIKWQLNLNRAPVF